MPRQGVLHHAVYAWAISVDGLHESQDADHSLTAPAIEVFNLGDPTFNFDKSTTQAAYASLEGGFAERSGYADCRNYAAQRSIAFPPNFLTLPNHVGIDSLKEGEAFEYGAEPSGKHLYGGWFYYVGIMSATGEYQVETEGFSYFIAA